MIKVNPTSIRTSANYNINDFAIDCKLIDKSNTFNSPQITGNIKQNCVATPTTLVMGDVVDNQRLNVNTDVYTVATNGDVTMVYNLDNQNSIHNSIIKVLHGIQTNITIMFNGKHAYHNGAFVIEVGDNAIANVNFVDNLQDSVNLTCIQSNQEQESKLDVNIVNFTNLYTIFKYVGLLSAPSALFNLNHAYLGTGQAQLDFNYNCIVLGKSCECNINSVGALKDNSVKHFKGIIDFKTGCAKSVGQEKEECLLIDATAHSTTLPAILCSEEDVDGKHATSVGKIDENVLFYLMTRGLTKTEATKLIIQSHFKAILRNINNAKLQEQILNNIDKVINNDN